MKTDVVHIRVGAHLKKEMKELIRKGVFTNESEIIRKGLEVILKNG